MSLFPHSVASNSFLGFEYYPAITVTSIQQNFGPAKGSTPLLLYGQGFYNRSYSHFCMFHFKLKDIFKTMIRHVVPEKELRCKSPEVSDEIVESYRVSVVL